MDGLTEALTPHGLLASMTKRFSHPHVQFGTGHFGWANWKALHGGFSASGWHSQERWQLAFLHSTRTLDALAQEVLFGFKKASKPATVSVQSIWIDGTPQVTGVLQNGCDLAQCELADLLFIVNQMDPAGAVVQRTGLLVQGKTAKRHNRLPSNPSTKKERLLLEVLDRSRPLSVFRDVNLKGLIGSYTFGSGIGLQDCARYLMMAKTVQWDCCPVCSLLAPLQMGWPKSRFTSFIDPTTSLVQAMRQSHITGGMGRSIQDKGTTLACEWSRLVWDLLGAYEPVEMRGYGGQNRVNVSRLLSFQARGNVLFDTNPPVDVQQAPEFFDHAPSISVIQVNIRSSSTDQVRG